MPERLVHASFGRPLDVGRMANQLQAEVQVLRQEKIIQENKAEDLQKQLSQIQEDSSGYDPDKTWEALDHIKESNSQAAKQAAEEAVAKTTALTEAETLAQGLQQASDAGMSDLTASQGAQDLANMLAAAKLDDGLLDMKVPPELLNNLNGLNKEQLQKLLHAIQFDKDSLQSTVANLENLKLIDAATLAECLKACQCNNPKALADYLATCKNGCDQASLECLLLGKGGPGGGGPPAPMTWSDPKSEKNLKFQEHVLSSAINFSDARLVGLSRAAPQLSGKAVAVEHGALADTPGSGGSANAQVILPEQRQAVESFFKREGQ
ncbi:MAG TPA: hypothetical protein VL970_02450 [Candidatus Acidoferrales bacterium]|nr:hypothetical protein [Candidatus Acidoferrales bacterium]